MAMPGDNQWRRALREAMAERAMRQRRPNPDELIAYVEGRLSPGEREEIEEAAALHPDVARALAELASFPDVEPPPGVEAPSDEEVTASWRRFRPRLEELRGSRPAGEAEPRIARPPAAIQPPRRRFERAWAQAAALFFFLTTAGLLMYVLADRTGAPEPVVNLAVAELSPVGEGVRRSGGGEAVSLPPEADRLVLVLALADAREYPAYRLLLEGVDGETSWTTDALRRFPDGTFRVLLPRHLLTSGRYRIEVAGLAPAGPVTVARYELALEVE
jgi:hypothetical protein